VSENLYCSGQKTLSEEGKKNYERIFKKETSENSEEDTED